MEKLKRNIKTNVVTWMLVLVLSIGGGLCNTTAVVKADMTVYITRTGSKYHTHKCGNGTYYASNLTEAKGMGLTPCSKCFPNGAPSSSGSGSSSTHRRTAKPKVVKPIKINKTSLLLLKGKTAKLKIKYATKSVKWKSNKKSVATVSKNGKVKGKKAGKAIITATVGGKTKKCSVIVEAPKLNKSTVNIKVGKTEKLTLKGCKHHIKWYSADSDIVKVSKGNIKAKEIGATKIYAVCHGKKFSCKINVTLPDVENVSLNNSQLYMSEYESQEIYANIYPIYAMDYYDIIWKSENENVVRVEYDMDEYATLRAVGKGETNVVMIIGNKKVKCHIFVQ